jgi:thiol-disulfide isomerase/thioredoxin
MRDIARALALVLFVSIVPAALPVADRVAALPPEGVKIGDAPPAITVDEWIKGPPVTSFASGTVYLVEFWATWCGPCVKNIPHLTNLQREFQSRGLVVIGIAAAVAGR